MRRWVQPFKICLDNSAEGRERSAFTLGYFNLPCCMRDTVWNLKKTHYKNLIWIWLIDLIWFESEASRGVAVRGVTVKPTDCGFDPHSRRWNFFAPVSRLNAALSSATQHTMPPEFIRKWGTECLNTRFPLPGLSAVCGIQREADLIYKNLINSICNWSERLDGKVNLFLLFSKIIFHIESLN